MRVADMTVNESCNVQSTKDEEMLFKCNVIMWDEASMIPCAAVNMVDKMLKDLCKSEEVSGEKYVIFGGNFRQILPSVVKFANPSTIINSS